MMGAGGGGEKCRCEGKKRQPQASVGGGVV